MAQRINTGSRVALVADHPTLTDALHGHVHRVQGHAPFLANYANVREFIGVDTDGLLLVAVGSATDWHAALHLVQDLSLQKLPPLVVLLEGPDAPAGKVADLEKYVYRCLRWPEDAERLTALVRDLGRCQEFSATPPTVLEELLTRQLLAWTPSLLPLVDRIALAANHDVTILLNGETGTGKTYLARLIHEYSPRKQHRFLTVPCGAISSNLVESEFFGHVKGAFTGADRPKIGKFAAVGQGTILLDEIDTLGLEQQATLLRVIETGEFEPVGCVDTQRCHARLIVASNLDLEAAVARARFRPDLYFRLNVMSFHLPPLRERVQDVAPLARNMAARFNRKFHKDLFDIHPTAIAALENFSWPGNLRQLENVIQHAVLVSSGPELLLQHLPQALQDQPIPQEAPPQSSSSIDSLHHQRDLIERNVIHRALISNGFSRTRAADSLGISRVTLYKKMKKYGLMKNPVSSAAE